MVTDMTTTAAAAATYALKGVNSEEHTCSLCGRTNLVRVAWLAPLDADGNEVAAPSAYGTDCAALLLLGSKSASNNATVRKNGELLDLVARWLRKGHAAERCARGYTMRSGWSAEVVDGGVRCWNGLGWVTVTA